MTIRSQSSSSHVPASPTQSVNSADEALFELLGIQKLNLDEDNEDGMERHSTILLRKRKDCLTDGDDNDDNDDNGDNGDNCENDDDDDDNGAKKLSVTEHVPPQHCHRPLTRHTPLLLETPPLLLSPAQCYYIINNIAYRTTNNGGITFGPTYITAAAQYHTKDNNSNNNWDITTTSTTTSTNTPMVQLLKPNHHKVCVFYSDIVLTWLYDAFQTRTELEDKIQKWCRMNHFKRKRKNNTTKNTHGNNNKNNNNNNHSSSLDHENNVDHYHYRINPRLRLVRYDADDEDIFLPHYDATTTTTMPTTATMTATTTTTTTTTTTALVQYESKLTILLYLNTGNGIDFNGGTTVFLNSLESQKTIVHDHIRTKKNVSLWHNNLEITPELGKLVVFNHELYHASLELIPMISVKDKCVLQKGITTVVFPRNGTINADVADVTAAPPAAPRLCGTKFVLRTDVMFPVDNDDECDDDISNPRTTTTLTDTLSASSWLVGNSPPKMSLSEKEHNEMHPDHHHHHHHPTTTTTKTIQAVLDQIVMHNSNDDDGDHDEPNCHQFHDDTLLPALQQLDMGLNTSLTTILAIGLRNLEVMLLDLHVDPVTTDTFVRTCQKLC